jgi:copper chaperone
MTSPEKGTDMTDKTTFIVNDMTCNHCVGTVRSALEEALPGAEVEINLETHSVSFTGDRAKGEEAIRGAGYTPEAT